jgi:hypothetical protein
VTSEVAECGASSRYFLVDSGSLEIGELVAPETSTIAECGSVGRFDSQSGDCG